MIRKIFIIAVALWILTASTQFSLASPVASEVPSIPEAPCVNLDFEIYGSFQVITGTNQEYSLHSNTYTGSLASAQFSLIRDNKLLERKVGEKYLRSFSQGGTTELQVDFVTSTGCAINLRKTIRSFSTGVAYLSLENQNAVVVDLQESLVKKGIFMQTLAIPKTQALWQTLAQTEFLYKNIAILKESKVILIQTDDAVSLVGLLAKMIRQDSNLSNLLTEKSVYVISDQSTNLLSKLLASHVRDTGLKEIYLMGTSSLSLLLLRMDESLSGNYTPPDLVRVSYDSTNRIFSLSRLVEYLLYQGVSLSFLGVLLTLTLAILAINFLKQVVGLYAFGIYAPIFLAVTLQFLDVTLLSILLTSAVLSTLIVHRVVKKLYLLHNAKHSLLITLYFIISMILLYFGFITEGVSLQGNLLDNIFSIFPFILIIFVVEKIFDEESAIFTRETLINLTQFIVVVGVSYFIVRSTYIQYFLLSYTDVILLIMILNLAIGRYTGLQVFEYFRFEPILKSFKDEE